MEEHNKKPTYVHKDFGEAKPEDIHLTKGFTGWVHHHRRMAKWFMKFLIAGVASLLYYLRREQGHIEDEEKGV